MLMVFGSVNADLMFEVERLPRPGETVLCASYDTVPGGKGSNQAAAAAKAGAEVKFIGHLGDDGYAPFVRGKLSAAGVDIGGLETSSRPTAIAVIGVDAAGENSIIVASGANLDTSAAQVDDGALATATTLLCQNEVRPEETASLIRRAHAKGVRTILNMAPAGPLGREVLEALDVLVVNELEAAAVADEADMPPRELASRLASEHDLACVITLGAEGALAAFGDELWQVPALAVKPVDTTGAGDAFVGVLAAALDEGRDLPDALRRASVAAALSCENLGAQTAQPDRAQIEARLPGLAPSTRLSAA